METWSSYHDACPRPGAASSPWTGPLSQGNWNPRRPWSFALLRAASRVWVRNPSSARAASGWRQEEGWQAEGLDVPHHVAVVVVVVVPLGEPEDRGARWRRCVDRPVEVEEGRIGQALPKIVVGIDDDAPFPQLLPFVTVLLADPVEALGSRLAGQSGRLAVRVMVEDARHDRRDLTQAVGAVRPSPAPVLRREAAFDAPIEHLALDICLARQLGHMGDADLRFSAERGPRQGAVARRLVTSGTPDRPPGDAPVHLGDVHDGPEGQIAGQSTRTATSWTTSVGSFRLQKVRTSTVATAPPPGIGSAS